MKSIMAFSLLSIAILLIADFYTVTVRPALYLIVNQENFVTSATECNLALSNVRESDYISRDVGSIMRDQATNSKYVTLAVCHDFDLLATRMLSHGVDEYRLRELYIQSLESERLPLRLLAEPPKFRWER